MDDDAQEHAKAGLKDRDVARRIALTADIVCAYISNNSVRPSDLTELIVSVRRMLDNPGQPIAPIASVAEPVDKPTPAQIRKSITPDGLTSFLDGKRYQTLKRHLWSQGLDPQTYRERFGLPSSYPMVSANYSAQRSAMAKSIGLGQSRKTTASEPAASSKTSQEGGPRRKAKAAE